MSTKMNFRMPVMSAQDMINEGIDEFNEYGHMTYTSHNMCNKLKKEFLIEAGKILSGSADISHNFWDKYGRFAFENVHKNVPIYDDNGNKITRYNDAVLRDYYTIHDIIAMAYQRILISTAKSKANAIGLKCWPLLLGAKIDPEAFVVAERILSKDYGFYGYNMDGKFNYGGFDSKGHKGLSSYDIASYWYRAGCKNTTKFRLQVNYRMLAMRSDSLSEFRNFIRGYKWLAQSQMPVCNPLSRKAYMALGRLSPELRAAAIQGSKACSAEHCKVVRVRDLNWSNVSVVMKDIAENGYVARCQYASGHRRIAQILFEATGEVLLDVLRRTFNDQKINQQTDVPIEVVKMVISGKTKDDIYGMIGNHWSKSFVESKMDFKRITHSVVTYGDFEDFKQRYSVWPIIKQDRCKFIDDFTRLMRSTATPRITSYAKLCAMTADSIILTSISHPSVFSSLMALDIDDIYYNGKHIKEYANKGTLRKIYSMEFFTARSRIALDFGAYVPPSDVVGDITWNTRNVNMLLKKTNLNTTYNGSTYTPFDEEEPHSFIDMLSFVNIFGTLANDVLVKYGNPGTSNMYEAIHAIANTYSISTRNSPVTQQWSQFFAKNPDFWKYASEAGTVGLEDVPVSAEAFIAVINSRKYKSAHEADPRLLSFAELVDMQSSTFENYHGYIKATPKKSHEMLPFIRIDGNKVPGMGHEYVIEKLDYDDPVMLGVGLVSACCQHLEGFGHKAAKHSYNEPSGAVYVLRKNGEICAQAWVWRNDNDGVVFDSIEGRRSVRASVAAAAFYALATEMIGKLCIKKAYLSTTSYGLTSEISAIASPIKEDIKKTTPIVDYGYMDGYRHKLWQSAKNIAKTNKVVGDSEQ